MALTRTVYRTCPLCEATCGLQITLDGDGVIRVEGDREDAFSRGYLCPKGAAIGELHVDPDRLCQPMIRQGKSWERVSWEKAFEEVEKGLMPIMEKYGRNAVAVFLGNPNVHTMAGALYVRPLLKALGTRNIFTSSTVDQMPKHVSSGLMFGSPSAIPVPDIDRTDYLLIMGANPVVSNGSLCTAPDFPGRLRDLKSRGGRLVVIDPCRTRTAKLAHEHLFIRPVTDPLFMLAIINTLFAEGLTSLGRLEPHVTGLKEIHDLCQPFSPETVAPICGITQDVTRRIARDLSGAKRAAVYGRMGMSTVAFGALSNWLVDVVNILTGNLDRPGGAMFPTPAHVPLYPGPGGKGFTTGRWSSRVKGFAEVMGEFPIGTLADEIETPGEGQVRALITVAGNPVLSTPNSTRLDNALAHLDFMVSVDFYLNETTRHAHVILPPASPLCHGHFDFFLYGLSVRNIAHYSPPSVDLKEHELDKGSILLKLALIAAGQGSEAKPRLLDDLIIQQMIEGETKKARSPVCGRNAHDIMGMLKPYSGPERILDFLLRMGPYGSGFGAGKEGLDVQRLLASAHGIDLGPLAPRIPEILQTPSRRIELAPSPLVSDVQRLKGALKIGTTGDLLLVGRRNLRSNNSWMHNIPQLHTGRNRCTLQVHPRDAARLGLKDTKQARIRSRVGALIVTLEISEDVMPGVVSLPHGWGHDLPGTALHMAQMDPGVNSNILTDEAQMDPLSGNAVLNGIPVTLDGFVIESPP